MELSEKKLKELKEKKISIEDLNDKYFYTKKDRINTDNALKLLNENICSFKELVDKFKSIKDLEYAAPCLCEWFSNKEFFQDLMQNNRLNTENLKYLLNKIDKSYELDELLKNTSLLKYIVDNDLFKELVEVDTFKNSLLHNEELFKELTNNNIMTQKDTRYLLSRIDNDHELNGLCEYNVSLLKYILNEFILNKEIVDKLNTILENDEWCKDFGIHTVFKLIKHYHKNNEEILELNELNKYAYSFNEKQSLELIEVLKDNEVARNRLKYIIKIHVESNYDFDSLIDYLNKKEKKNILNI